MLKNNSSKPSAWNFIFSGTQLAVSVLLGVFAGLWLDRRLETKPWLTLVCSFLGIGAGLYQFIKDVSRPQ